MKNYSFNFIKVDLRIINTLENCIRILKDNNISEEKVSAQKLFDLKSSIDIIFFDDQNLSLVAFIRKKEKQIEFVKEFYDDLHDLDALKYTKKQINLQSETLKLDLILEKISSKGLNSLTPREREFLDNQSKK